MSFVAGQIVLGLGQDVYRVVDGKERAVYSENLIFRDTTIMVQMAYVKRLPDEEDGSLGYVKYMPSEALPVGDVEERLSKHDGAEVLVAMVRQQEAVWDAGLDGTE